MCVERQKMKNTKLTQPRGMKKLYALTEKKPIDLSLSENPLGCSPLVSSALKNIKMGFNDYPSPNGKLLKKKLAQELSLDESNFFIANGSESVINDLPRVFGKIGEEVLVPALSFPMFAVCSQLAGKEVVSVQMTNDLGIDLFEIAKAVSSQTSLIFICNPNNPTGSILSKQSILQFIDCIPSNILVVVDEANIEFGGETMINEVIGQDNLIVLRTFSKGFGLALLRIGFAVANETIVQKLEEETPIFQISGLSEKLACIALEDKVFIEETKKFASKQRLFLKNELEKKGFLVFPSEANNLFVRVPSYVLANQFSEQLKQKGVSLVMGSNFDGFDNSFFRVSVRDEKTNQLFITKINELLDDFI